MFTCVHAGCMHPEDRDQCCVPYSVTLHLFFKFCLYRVLFLMYFSCHSTHVKIRGQLARVSSLLFSCRSWGLNWVIRLGGKHLLPIQQSPPYFQSLTEPCSQSLIRPGGPAKSSACRYAWMDSLLETGPVCSAMEALCCSLGLSSVPPRHVTGPYCISSGWS